MRAIIDIKKLILGSLFLLAVSGVAPVFAQEEVKSVAEVREYKTESFPYIENQCEAFGKSDFEGTLVSLDVVDADIRDVLTLANPFGCNFVIDEAAEKVRVTVKVSNIPWNLALYSILYSQDLEIKIEDSKFRILEMRRLGERETVRETQATQPPLYTEFVRFEYLLLESSKCFPNADRIASREHENSKRFMLLLRKMLSPRGEIEVDSRSITLIITDEKDKIEKIREFVKLIDKPDLTLEVILNNPNLEIK